MLLLPERSVPFTFWLTFVISLVTEADSTNILSYTLPFISPVAGAEKGWTWHWNLGAEMPLKSPVNIPTAASSGQCFSSGQAGCSLQPYFQCGRSSELSPSGALGGLCPEVWKQSQILTSVVSTDLILLPAAGLRSCRCEWSGEWEMRRAWGREER